MSIEDKLSTLTYEQISVIYWMLKGEGTDQIMIRLVMGESTVRKYRTEAYRQLGFPADQHWTKTHKHMEREHYLDAINSLIEYDPENLKKFPLTKETEEPSEAPPVEVIKQEEKPPEPIEQIPPPDPVEETEKIEEPPIEEVEQLKVEEKEEKKVEQKPPESPVIGRLPRAKPTPPPPVVQRRSWVAPLLGGAFLMCLLIAGIGYWLWDSGLLSVGRLPSTTYTPPVPTTPLESPTVASSTTSEVVPIPGAVDTAVAETMATIVPTNTEFVVVLSTWTVFGADTPLVTKTPKPYYDQGEVVDLAEDVTIVLVSDFSKCDYPDEKTIITLRIRNNSGSQFMARFDNYDFSIVDDLGNSYELVYPASLDFCHETETTTQEIINGGNYKNITLAFYPNYPLDAKYLLVTANNISGYGPLVFKKDI